MNMQSRQKIQATETSRLRLQTIVRLRWLAIAGQLATVLVISVGLGFEMPVGWCLGVIALSIWLNITLQIRYPARYRLSTSFSAALLSYDILQLGLLLFLTGGIENPFAFLIVAPVTVAAASLPAAAILGLALLTAAVSAALIQFHFPLPWFSGEAISFASFYKFGLWSSMMCSMLFMGFYARRLSREARQMSDALAATEHVLAREQKLHALDGLAAAAAHELGTPLSTIAVIAKELQRELPKDSPFAEDVALMRSQAQRCREILTGLSQRSDATDPLHAQLPLSHMLDEVVEPYRVFDTEIRIDARAEDTATAEGRMEPIARRNPGVLFGLTNLIENAADFATSEVVITARWNSESVSISIIDDGPGFPPAIINRLGEPYVTTRPALERSDAERSDNDSSGLGLGFFIAKTLLERSGADLALANRDLPESGAIVSIDWPRKAFERQEISGSDLFGGENADWTDSRLRDPAQRH